MLWTLLTVVGTRRTLALETEEAAEQDLQDLRSSATMEFQLQQQGKIRKRTNFQRYQALVLTNQETTRGASIHEWIQAMLHSDQALQAFIDVLRQNPYPAFFFETKSVTLANVHNQTFEFVLVNAPRLDAFASTHPNPGKFATPFAACTTTPACVFTSLHKGSTLISPQPPADPTTLTHYAHLAAFCRLADPTIVAATWRMALQAYLAHMDERAWYFSTSGLGVAWLHFRVEDTPRYYSYPPFKET